METKVKELEEKISEEAVLRENEKDVLQKNLQNLRKTYEEEIKNIEESLAAVMKEKKEKIERL